MLYGNRASTPPRDAQLPQRPTGTGEELGGRVKRLREALTAAGPYTGGSSAPGPSTPGSSTAGPSTAGPSTPGPSTPGSSTAGPSAAGPFTAGSSTAGSPAGGSSARAAAKGMPALKVHVGGPALVDAELQDLSESDLKRAEAVVLPGTLILLVLVFGSVVAALLPLLIGVLSIAGTLLVLSVLGRVTDVSVFALNLTTVLGLGLGIDYGLLIVSRFREKITGGHSARDAALRTVRTAGHTIVFSAATVCAALATLLVFPPYFLRFFAYAGIAVVAIAAVAALTVMPALLTLLGKRVNAWPVPWRRRVQAGCASRWWEALARRVVRRPVLAAVPVIGLLAVLAAPFAHAGFATPDDRALAGRLVGGQIRWG
ncbi:MMPL family transporter [Streptomyces avermitilis]|uniref:MMPL family transporter n=1 Tax=Streptomyces avermitilis TaxID=33903 RepID=UPI0033C789E1